MSRTNPLRPIESPTTQIYEDLADAYNFFNDRMFAGGLPQCLITFQRRNKAYGYFWAERWAQDLPEDAGADEVASGLRDEIALNPDHMERGDKLLLSTLVHEMAHCWQQHEGNKNPTRAYHNAEWADKMEELGLMPSSTGQPGGKRTGVSMTHYIIEGGQYETCYTELESQGLRLRWKGIVNLVMAKAKRPKDKFKYECSQCQSKVWGKPELNVLCGECNNPFIMEEKP